jgi:hypothetical protein
MLRWAVLLVCVAASGQVLKDQPLPLGSTEAVEFLSPDKVTVSARHTAQIDLYFRVADGLHINSHAPLDKFLIPARFAVAEGQGLNVRAVDFPPGAEYALQREKLSVYTGEFVLHAHLLAQPGEHQLQGALHYQACDNNTCMPPHSIPVSVTVVAQ